MKYDVYFYEAFEEEQEQLKNFMPDKIKAGYTWKTIQENGDETPPAGVISLRTQSIIPLSWSRDLKAILSRSTGFDHLLKYKRETDSDVKLGYLPLYCNRSVAEQALTLWMALSRKLPEQMESFKTFHRDGLTGNETEGKTLLVVGVGNIGSEICIIGQGLGMKVLGVDLVEKYPFVEYATFDEAVGQADIIVCAMNLTRENENYFTYEKLSEAKPSALFVNIARGELSYSSELLKLMKAQKLAGIALDVFKDEAKLAVSLRSSEPVNSREVDAVKELQKYSNVIFTPHNSFNTQESVVRKSGQSAEQLMQFFETGEFKWYAPE
ncbi:MAG: hydroxyacid dehydrogenase [Candidatus Marinimicrobia bacterium]|nr:hydroxyacid dehydrogenase [Candidatus Neomarinimicrobiota bacterium]